jgi:hypothetical protein
MIDLMKALGVLLVVGGVLFSFWQLTRTAKKEISRTSKAPLLMASFLSVFAGVAFALEDRITEFTIKGIGTIRTATEQAIADADDVASLKARVENQSATVDLVASQATKAKDLSETVAAQTKEAADSLKTLNAAITDAKVSLDDLKQQEGFTTLVMEAQSDERQSYDKLRTLAEDQNYRFAKLAGQAWLTIFEAHNGPFMGSGFTIPWKPGVDPSKLSFDELINTYQSAPAPLKPAILEYISHRNDISKLDLLDFLMSVMKNDPSLTAAEYAGRYFTQQTGQNIKPMALDFLVTWWNEHRHEFEGK